MRLSAETLVLDGRLAAMVRSGDYGGGSGGGIYVSVTTLQGSGQITAAGGSGDYGGGGGGRVAVYAADYSQFDLASIQALGGTVSHANGQPGGAGTVYLRDTDLLQGTLLVDGRDGGAGWTPLGLPAQDTLTIPDAVVVRGAIRMCAAEHVDLALDFQSTLTVEQQALLEMDQQLPVTLAGTLTIDGATLLAAGITAPEVSVINGGLLTSRTSTTTQMYKLELDVAGTVLVDATSRIDVSGKGYRPGYTTGNTTVGGATGNSGGSYGGLGGVYERRGECGVRRLRGSP